jgi:cell division protein FtsN
LVLGGLAIAVLIVWIVGAKRATAQRAASIPTNNSDASPSNEAKP